MGFLNKIKDLASKNADKVDTAIDKAGNLVDKKTQGKYTQHVDKVQQAAKKAARNNAGGAQQPPVQRPQTPPQTPPAPPAAPAGPPPIS